MNSVPIIVYHKLFLIIIHIVVLLSNCLLTLEKCFIYVLQMPRGFSRGGQGRVPVPSVLGSSEVVVLDPSGSVELLNKDNIVWIVFSKLVL